jgi:hypothetical protein
MWQEMEPSQLFKTAALTVRLHPPKKPQGRTTQLSHFQFPHSWKLYQVINTCYFKGLHFGDDLLGGNRKHTHDTFNGI